MLTEYYEYELKRTNKDIANTESKYYVSYLENYLLTNWDEKVNKYLYYCLDGGICKEGFNIKILLSFWSGKVKDGLKGILYKLLFLTYKNDIGICISQMLKDSITCNFGLLTQIVKNMNLYEFFDFNVNEQMTYKLLALIVEDSPSLELLEAINLHLKGFNTNDTIKRGEYLKNFDIMLKGLACIYVDDNRCPKLAIVACKLIICLCSNDSTGSALATIVDNDFFAVITKRLNSFDYNLYQMNLILLFVISEKIKKANLTETLANAQTFFDDINRALSEGIYRDKPTHTLKNIIKVLYNFLASDDNRGLIRINILAHLRNSIRVMNNSFDDDEEYVDDNIICNLLHYLKLPYMIEQMRSENLFDYYKYLKLLKPDGLMACDRFVLKRSDYTEFFEQCSIDERVIKFFQLMISDNNTEVKNYFLIRYNIFKLLFDYKKLSSMKYIFLNYITLMEKNDKVETNKFVEKFHLFLSCLCKFFGFIYFLLNGNSYALNELKKKSCFRDSFCDLFDTVSAESENSAVKNIIANKEYQKEFTLYLSTMYSLKTLIHPQDGQGTVNKKK
jgi:hypothetical protein